MIWLFPCLLPIPLPSRDKLQDIRSIPSCLTRRVRHRSELARLLESSEEWVMPFWQSLLFLVITGTPAVPWHFASDCTRGSIGNEAFVPCSVPHPTPVRGSNPRLV